ncbi:uncharacterized protein LOC124838102 [Vigna umbellata]|uniref:uncharacterized protein LOC124838102 n=1 Tax=Vigna umbellata TaxID=87088 RepID=UPI001F5FA485|nr:uncharacterized protein LOC124838102 [Vigna umbellata]
MATETSRSSRRVGTNSSSQAPEVEEIVPNSGWTEDHSGHFLLVDLPDFKKEEVSLQVDSSGGHIIVKGERYTNEEKRVHFELKFAAPADGELENISGNFDSEILYVNVPKRASQEHRESGIEKASNAHFERAEETETEEHDAVNDDYVAHRYDTPHHEDGENEERRHNIDDSQNITRKRGQKHISRSAVEVLMRNKGVVTAAIFAFSFGLYVSHKFHSWNEP